MSQKFVFITGGVLSSLGKGITAASIGAILEHNGLKVSIMKCDPYLNVDAGTMNPEQHGEVYVTADGTETDLDLGHYHRYCSSSLSQKSIITMGKILTKLIREERSGSFNGETLQIVPHVTNEIQESFKASSCENSNVTIIEIGGTVGDMECLPFLEAIRQFMQKNRNDCISIHLTHVPYLDYINEFKTKPTQHSVQNLKSYGIFPDLVICRAKTALPKDILNKISSFCNVDSHAVIGLQNVSPIYKVPEILKQQHLDEIIIKYLNIDTTQTDKQKSMWWMDDVPSKIDDITDLKNELITIGMVGKYSTRDAYKSVIEALYHAAWSLDLSLKIQFIHSEDVDKDMECDGYLIPGGFGIRGVDSKMNFASHCRVNEIPYFGICLGMQVMLIEFARNVLNLQDASSTEIDPNCSHPIVNIIDDHDSKNLGGTLRLGDVECEISPDSKAFKAYGQQNVNERHRHRYKLNNEYLDIFTKNGIKCSAYDPKSNIVEIIELENHPWMLATQFHPEFISKPSTPHPLFIEFIKASALRKRNKHESLCC